MTVHLSKRKRRNRQRDAILPVRTPGLRHTVATLHIVLCLLGWIGPIRSGLAQHHSQHAATPPPVPLFDNLGDYHHAITTESSLAQRYFDQGLRLIYAFNYDEALRSFDEAARLDPNCAMAYWGSALALAPNISNPVLDPEQERDAYNQIQKALSLSKHTSPRERAYVAALAKRYSIDPKADRASLQVDYANAARDLANRYPDDPDAAALSAESLLILRPWDHWTLDGKPQPGTLEVLNTLENVLKKYPNHPGANHFYIHALEASPYPERALASAERLPGLMPGAGHLVHMPSHVFMRIGRYADAAESSGRAAVVDIEYIKKWKPQGVYPMMMYPHNIYFLWAALSMEGRSAEAIRAARALVAAYPENMVREMPMLQFFTPVPLFTLARFGKWEEILNEPHPPGDFPYLTGMWHYARGLAMAATGRAREAAMEKSQLEATAAAMAAKAPPQGNSPAALLRLALKVLDGELAAREGKTQEAVAHLKEAVRLQDMLRYDEPPPWYYGVRQSLGAVLLEAGRAAEAEVIYREDLKKFPENGWSLNGLMESLRAQKKDFASVQTRFRNAWARADVILPASRF
jgi:tetratricopeptide (TPR) repeat protein